MSAYSELRPIIPVQTFYKCSAVAEMDDRLAIIDMGRKEVTDVPLLVGGGRAELGPHLARGLPAYQVAS